MVARPKVGLDETSHAGPKRHGRLVARSSGNGSRLYTDPVVGFSWNWGSVRFTVSRVTEHAPRRGRARRTIGRTASRRHCAHLSLRRVVAIGDARRTAYASAGPTKGAWRAVSDAGPQMSRQIRGVLGRPKRTAPSAATHGRCGLETIRVSAISPRRRVPRKIHEDPRCSLIQVCSWSSARRVSLATKSAILPPISGTLHSTVTSVVFVHPFAPRGTS